MLCIFLLIIVSWSAVSAADNSSADGTLINNVNGDLDDIDNVSINSNSDVLGSDDGPTIDLGDSYVHESKIDDDNNFNENYLIANEKNDYESVKMSSDSNLVRDNSDSILNTKIMVNGTDITDGDNATIKVLLTLDDGSAFSAPVIINVNGVNVSSSYTSDTWEDIVVDSANLIIGTNNVTVYYEGDSTHNPSNASAIINVEKNRKVTANVEVTNAVYGNPVVLKITNLSDAYGNLLSVFGGFQLVGPEHPYGSIMVRKGKCTVNFDNLPVGNYSAYIVFGNNIGGNYDFENYIVDFVVEKAPVILSANITDYKYGKEGNLNIKVADMKNKPIDGKINVTIDDETYVSDVTITNGEINVALENISINNHMSEITFYADNYVQTDIITQFNVLPRGKLTNLSADSLVMTYNDGYSWNVTLSDVSGNVIAGENVKFGVDGVFYDVVTDGDGVASLPIELSPGTYEVNATFEGNDDYEDSFIREIITVVRVVPAINVTADNIDYGDILVVNVNLSEGVSRRAIVDVDGMSKLVTLKNGKGSVKFSGIHAGNQTVVVSYNGDVIYDKASVSASVVVSRAVADIRVFASPVSYGDVLVVDVVLPEDVAGGVNVSVGDDIKFVSLTGGVGSVEFSDLSVGTHAVNVSYAGDENYLESSATINAKINRAIPEIQVSADEIEYGEALTVNLQLPSDVTRRVAVTIGNETKLVSLKEGIGSVKFMGLSAGDHEIDVVYNGDVNYMKSSVSVVAEVK